jgi:hypothetical protein
MDAVRTSRQVAVIATLLAIPIGIWGIHLVGRQDRLAGIATASAAAAAHGCHVDNLAVSQLVKQVRDKSTIGWAESGNDVADRFASGCSGSAASGRSPS